MSNSLKQSIVFQIHVIPSSTPHVPIYSLLAG